jgi:hypothetical protein
MCLQDASTFVTEAAPHPLQPPQSFTITSRSLDLVGLVASRTGFIPNRNFLVLLIPAQPASALPDGKTLTVEIQHSESPNFDASAILKTVVQTGTADAGAAKQRIVLPIGYNFTRYVRFRAVLSAGGGDCSGTWIILGVERAV